MADEKTEAEAEESTDPNECSPCSGTGKVISHLNEQQTEVDCPWCEGTGKFIPEHDAQAHFKGPSEDPE